MSVDLYVERVIARAKCVVIRLLAGIDYWRYGVEEVAAICRAQGIALALLPGDGRADPQLEARSTISPAMRARLDACFRHGGPDNMARALALAAHLAGLGDDPAISGGGEAVPVPGHGVHPLGVALRGDRPLAVLVFYRAYLLAGDLAPLDTLAAALDARGLDVCALHVSSLKEPEAAAFVAACKYPPAGRRSNGQVRAGLYGEAGRYQATANDEILVISMIETEEAIDNIGAILDVPGIDGIYVGPSDLGLSLGLPPVLDREEPRILAIYDRLLAETGRRGLFAGLHNGSAAYAARMIGRGFRFVTVANDAGLLARAARDAVGATRRAAGEIAG
jgi:2-keto-3-deoxy-L-rhamnonate aldolase RhmA